MRRTATGAPWHFELLVSPDVPEPDRTTLRGMHGRLNARFALYTFLC